MNKTINTIETFETKLKEFEDYSFSFYSINKNEIKMVCSTDEESYIILDTRKQDMTIYGEDFETIGDLIDVDAIEAIIDNGTMYAK